LFDLESEEKLKSLTVYLADLCYETSSGLSKDSLPLGVGTIAAYVTTKLQQEGIDAVFKVFILADDLLKAIETTPPHIVGLANFIWSENLTAVTIKKIKQYHPDILITTGGANISPHSLNQDKILLKKQILDSHLYAKGQDESVLEKFQSVDYFIHGEAEIPFLNLCRAYAQHSGDFIRIKAEDLPGCSAVVDGKLINGSHVDDIRDLDEIPSPYLMGFYDEIWKKYFLIPQIETNRGCPFQCTFCTVGSWEGKIRKHSVDYVKKEIMYLHDHSPNRLIRFADSNFGIVAQDIEIAKFIGELRSTLGYPGGIRLYTAESGVNGRVKEVMAYFKEMIPLNLSYQSMSDVVLKNIKRKNQSPSDIADMREYATQNGMMLSTELICGLPGETVESYTNGFDKLLKNGFESVTAYPLLLIRGADLDTPMAAQRWKFQIRYAYLGQNISTVDGSVVFEYSRLPVASNSYTEEEYFSMLSFSYFMFLMLRGGWYRELLLFAIENGISTLDIFHQLSGNQKEYPLFGDALTNIMKQVKMCYFESPEALRQKIEEAYISGQLESVYNYRTQLSVCAGTLISEENKQNAVQEVIRAITKSAEARDNLPAPFPELLDHLGAYSISKIISPFSDNLPEHLEFECPYDISTWANSNEAKIPLVEYRAKTSVKTILSVRNIRQHRDLHSTNHVKSHARRMHYYFETVTGSNMQRCVSKTEGAVKPVVPDPTGMPVEMSA
jgi:radical SAM superfamily enzyme YgiQ (UPF0313 family)